MATAPSAPITDVWPQVSTGQVTFYWRAPASDGGDPITKYTLSCAAISYSQDVSATRLDFTVTGLTDKTDYVFQITATNGVGASPAASFPVVQPGATPFGPTVATASTLNTSTALVSWTPSTLATEGSLRAYSVQVIPSTPAISSYFITMFPFKSTMAIAGLSTNTYYQFLVRGVNDVGYCAPFAYTSTLGFGISGAGAFSPSSLTGMALWLDANSSNNFTLSGSNITTWADRSPNAYTATKAGSPSLILSTSAVHFASGSYLGIPDAAPLRLQTNSFSIYGVYRTVATGQTQFLMSKFVDGGSFDGWNLRAAQNSGGSVRPVWYAGGTPDYVITSTPIVDGSYRTLSMYQYYSTLQTFVDGGLESTIQTTTPTNATVPLNIGVRQTDGSSPFNGSVREIIMYSNAITPFDRQKVEGYLSWKWGLNANLPTTHPFKAAAPTSASVFSPSSFSGLQLWLDAAQITGYSNSQAITSWADSSPSPLSNTTAGSPSAPTYRTNQMNGLPIVRFNGGYINLGSNLQIGTDAGQSIFTVLKFNETGNDVSVIGRNNNAVGRWAIDRYQGNTRYFIQAPTAGIGLIQFANSAGSNTQILNMSWDRTTIAGYVNATLQVSSGFASSENIVNSSLLGIGAMLEDSSRWYINADVAEVLYFNRGLSTDDRQTVEGYLAWKWGLQGSLPSTHPYKSQNPASLVSPTPYFATNFNNGNDANLINYASSNLSTNTVTSTGYSYSCPSSNYLTSPIQMQNTNTVSYCISIYRTGTLGGDGRMGLLFSRDGTPASGLNFINDTNLSYSWNNESDTWSYNTDITVPLNTWMHVTMTISPTEAKWYINGALSTTKTYSHSSINISTVCIGADTFSSKYFRGLVDNVAVYNTTLTAAQISSIYAQTLVV